MTENIINSLILYKDKATKSQKKLIDFLLTSNLNDIIYLSITELSDLTSVGEATILRFCRELGYKGYQDFKLVIAQELVSNQPTECKESYIKTIADNFMESIVSFRDNINIESIDKAIEIILSSKRISVFGVGNSYVPALELHNRLNKLGILTFLEIDSHHQNILTASLNSEDVVIIFSVSGCTDDGIEVADIAKQNGTKVIVVTSHLKSPLVKNADVVLYSVRKESPLEGGSMLTKLGQLFIVDVLSTGISIKDLDYYNKKIKNANISVVKKLL